MNAITRLPPEIFPEPESRMRLRLRQATQNLHSRVEQHIGLVDRVWKPETYSLLLQAMRGMHVPLERRLTSIDWSGTAIVMSDRCKTPWLDSDLAHFGFDGKAIADLIQCSDLPVCDNVSGGLGVLYVLEGSTLGGQVILHSLQTQLGISAQAGGRFFAGYGSMAGAQWRGYLAELERVGTSPPEAAQIEQAALQTFAAFERWLARAGLPPVG
jgi:heme oxygenase